MKDKSLTKILPPWQTALLGLMLAVLGIVQFAGIATKWAALLAGVGIISLFMSSNLKRLWNRPTLLLAGYAVFSMLTAFWAMSGKFFLREYSKIFIGMFFFFLILLSKREAQGLPRRVIGIIAGISALYALMSVEAASTGRIRSLLYRLPSYEELEISFSGTRLTGIFGNSNIESSIYAIGILFSIALVCGSEKKWQRILWLATLSFCAFAFLLVLSIGAIMCFVVAVIIFLIFAGKGRSAALLRMLETAIPTLVCGFAASRYFNIEEAAVVPLLLMLVNAGITVVLDILLPDRIIPVLESHQKLAFGAIAGVAALVVVYFAAGLLITGPYTFGAGFGRTMELAAGTHALKLEADGNIAVSAYSQNRQQVITNGSTALYYGDASEDIVFTVPENSVICYFWFSAEEGVTLRSAAIDGTSDIPLSYKLFPTFVANRTLNLWSNNSRLVREAMALDGFRLFLRSPVIGNGVGAFETGVTSVQDFTYETKYVHNHYIQVLLEDGIIGFALFVAALAAMGVALWKKRGQPRDSETYWIYPALCAEFVMNALQMLWDVSMSSIVFTCFAYTFFGLVVSTCAEPIRAEVPATSKNSPKAQKRSSSGELKLRIGCMVFPAFYIATLLGNLYANQIAGADAATLDGFFSNLDQAVAVDLYEHNDWKLSYLVYSLNDETGSHRARADEYAEQLSKVQSNSIPVSLVYYYLSTGQYAKAIDEAKLGAAYSASNPSTWDNAVAYLKQAFLDTGAASPLLEDGALLSGLMEYRAMLEQYNERALTPLSLNEESRAFFDTVLALDACGGDTAAMLAILSAAEEIPE